MIRTIGYTYFLKDFGFQVDFYNEYNVYKFLKNRTNIIKLNKSPLLSALVRIYCLSPRSLFFLKFIINRFSLIKKIRKIKNPIIFHKNFTLGLYITLNVMDKCIYDIHGILDIQREEYERVNFKKKIEFYLNLRIEKNLFKYGNYFNATSPEMKKYLIKKYNIDKDRIFIAEEGILSLYRDEIKNDLTEEIRNLYNLDENDRIIFFAGAFKSFGGAWDLVQAFYRLLNKLPDIKLLLIGTGQEESKIRNFINLNQLQGKIVLIGREEQKGYRNLPSFQTLAKIIICPDNENYYNHITPHIKIYDSIASGKPLIFSDLRCLKNILKDFDGYELFKPGNINDLCSKMEKILLNYEKYSNEALNNVNMIQKYSYFNRSKGFVQQIISKLYV